MQLINSTWRANFEGRTILVTNNWVTGAKLYVDDVHLATNRDLFSVRAEAPLLSGYITRPDGRRALVEVFIVSIITTKAMICVDGRAVGGDLAGSPPARAGMANVAYRGDVTAAAATEITRLQREVVDARTAARAMGVALALVLAGVVAALAR